MPAVLEAAPAPAPAPEPTAPVANAGAALAVAAPLAEPAPSAETPAAVAQPTTEVQPPKPARRKRARREQQTDLFGETVTAGEPAAVNAVEPADTQAPEPVQATTAVSGDGAGGEAEPEPEQEKSAAGEARPKEDRPVRQSRPAPPVNVNQLRKAVGQIVPLFSGRDPGAADCLRDNRAIFRSGFAPESYGDFEQAVKQGHFDLALDLLKKAVRRHGLTI